MRLAVVTFIMLSLPIAAVGQQALVRSGEHENFTRIVAPIAEGQEWSAEQEGRNLRFSVPQRASPFNISQVFNLIDRDRVATIESKGNALEIGLACDCRVATFVVQNRFVVLDIVDPGSLGSAPFIPLESSLATPPEDPITAPIARQTVAFDRFPPSTTRDLSEESALRPLALPTLARETLNAQERETLNEVQQRLAEELGSAATRGLLSLQPSTTWRDFSPPQEPSPGTSAPPPAIEPEEPDRVPNNMRISTSLDVPILSARPVELQSLSGFSCPEDAELDIANWADGTSFQQQMGPLRQQLYEEFDRINKAKALKLARLYIHFGFGAEAQQILRLNEDLTEKHRMLVNIAEIMEDGHASPDSVLPNLLDCDSDVALWAMLAGKSLEISHSIDPSAALRSLSKLPIHLRKFLAPILSERLLAYGDKDAAAMALRSLERLPDSLPSAAKFAQAKIALDEGEVGRGESKLNDVIDDNAEQSPEALIALVETRLAADQPLDPRTAGLIEAYAKEYVGSDLGTDLRRAHVLALAKSGQFDPAFEAFAELGGDDRDDAALTLRLQLLQELIISAPDMVFLDHLFQEDLADIHKLPKRPKLTLSQRLLDLGFPDHANEILETTPQRPVNRERQILAARIALSLQQPQRALTALDQMVGEDIDILRAQARQMAGDHTDAYRLYSEANETEAAAQSAFLAEETGTGTLENDPLFGPVLALSSTLVQDVTVPDPDGMLARSNAALDESQAARQALTEFLNAPEIGVNLPTVAE